MKKFLTSLLAVTLLLTVCFSPCSSEAKSKTKIPEDAFLYNDHYYSVTYEVIGWNEAKKACEKVGGYLAAFADEEECNAVWDYVASIRKEIVWIGFYNAGTPEEQNWKWANGEKVAYTNWRYNQPQCQYMSSSDSYEGYAVMGWSNNSQWDDFAFDGNYSGTRVQGYVCEWNGIEIMPEETTIQLNPGDSAKANYTIFSYIKNKAIDKTAKIKSGSKKVATVAADGAVTAVAPGACNLKLSYKDASAKVKVIVLPAITEGLAQKSVAAKSVTLKWTVQAGVSGYEIAVWNDAANDYKVAKTVTKAKTGSVKIGSLKAGTSYQFKVRAFVKSGSKKYYGEWSDPLEVITNE